MSDKKFAIDICETKLSLTVVFIASITLFFYNIYIGFIFFIIYLYMLIYNWKLSIIRKKKLSDSIKNLNFDIDQITKKIVMNSPTPICVIEFDGSISIYNEKFYNLVNKEDLVGKNIDTIIENLNLRKVLNESNQMYTDIVFNERDYTVIYNVVKKEEDNKTKYFMILYFEDKTDYLSLSKSYDNEKNVIALLQIDGFNEVLKSTPEDNRLLLSVDIEKILLKIEDDTNGALRKISREQYLLVINKENCLNLEKEKFQVLDKIREISQQNSLPVTLSIGVGRDGNSINENLRMAISALDLALGRGGDQAVVKTNDKFTFYGGKSKAIEKTTKVKSRLIGHALKQIILESEKIFIMGHSYPDMDAMGSAVGVYDICKSFNKNAKIVLDKPNDSIKAFIDRIKSSDYYKNIFIKCDDAIDECTKKTLVIVVDTHRPSYTECKKLLEITEKVAVIDHHRRGIEFINETVLLFHETYVSSTSELITELVQYIDDDVKINKLTAEGLLAGINLDTKNFTFKTGIRTFEAASYLKKVGADTVEVKKLFDSDINDVLIKAEIIQSAKMISENICIATTKAQNKNINIIVAQAADELLNIKDVEASFVLGIRNNKVFISARSLGNMNVHIIMEKLGGGGHKDVAGAQLDVSLDEAYKLLTKTIKECLKEAE